MAAPLSLSRATITRPDTEPLTKVSVIARAGTITVRRGRELLEQRTVTRVEALSRLSWQVTLDDGAQWTVTREKNCGCGS